MVSRVSSTVLEAKWIPKKERTKKQLSTLASTLVKIVAGGNDVYKGWQLFIERNCKDMCDGNVTCS